MSNIQDENLGYCIKIKLPSMKASVLLLVGNDKSIQRWVPRWCSNIGIARYIGHAEFKRFSHSVDCFRVVLHCRSAAMSVIAHEAIHAASFILEAMGCVSSWENDEIVAYLVQHICERAEEVVWGVKGD